MSPTVLPRPAQRAWWPREEIRSSIIFRSAALVAVAFIAASSLLLIQAWKDQREIVRQALASAVATANVLDREVMATSFLLKGLSSSPALRSEDLQVFYDQLKATSLPDGAWIILWDLQGQLINTLRPFGVKLPRVTDFARYQASLDRIRSKGVSVSDRAVGPIAQTYVIVVSLRTDGPDGEMPGFLSASITEKRLSALINEQRLPTGWTSSLLDRNGRHVATSGADRRVFEEQLPSRFVEALQAGQLEGHFNTNAARGVHVLAASHRSDVSGFTALTQVPTSLVNEPVYAAFRQIGFGAIALLLIGGIAGSALARRVGRPIEALATSAAKTKDELNFAEARHASFWRHTPESLFTVAVTPDNRFVFEGINPAHEQLTGLLASRILGKEPHECLTSEVADAVTARYRECVRRGEAISYSERLDLPGGVRFWRTNLAPVRDPATGRVVLLFGSARDVTSDLEASAELARLNERLQSILSSVSDCYCTFDREFRITAINPAAVQWLGLAEDSAVGTSLKEEFSGDHECMRGTRAAMIEHRAFHAEVASAFRPERWLDYHVYPAPEGVSVFFRDITEAKTAREELNALTQRLLDLQEEDDSGLPANCTIRLPSISLRSA
jgi:PAS domain S-box-containing protein